MMIRQDNHVLRLAQAVWAGVIVLSITLFVAGLPFHYHQLQTLTYPGIPNAAGVRAGLAELGLSSQSFALVIATTKGLLGFGFVAIAVVIALNQPEQPFSLFVSMTLVAFGTTFPDVLQALVAEQPVWNLPVKLLSMAGFICFFSLFWLFPTGHFVPSWTRWLIPIWIVEEWFHFFPVANSVVSGMLLLVFLALLASGVYALIQRYWRFSTIVEREQTRWIVFGFVTSTLAFLIYGFTSELVDTGRGYVLHELIGGFLMSAVFLLLPLSIANAILRHRLWGIDRLINRALVYSLLSTCGVGIYMFALGGIGALVGKPNSPLIGAMAVGIAALFIEPVRQRIQQAANRLLYGEREDPYLVLSRLGARLEDTLPTEALLPMVVQTISEALKLPYVAIALNDGDTMPIAAAWGTAQGDTFTQPLVYQQEKIGELRLSARAPEESFDRADARLLNDLARQSGISAHAYMLQRKTQQLTIDLQRSQERMIALREEEQRRLQRDLHDGLGPQLAGLTLRIDTARNLLREHPDAAEAMLTELSTYTQAAVADVRRLAYGLRPPALDELGAIKALRAYAAQYDPGPLRIVIDAPHDLPSLPAQVEVAIYRIVQEAITNVIRHAAADTCRVTIRANVSRQVICCDIRDNGQGYSSPQARGIGQRSMRERAAELNGSLTITSTPGAGTLVSAQIPFQPTQDAVTSAPGAQANPILVVSQSEIA